MNKSKTELLSYLEGYLTPERKRLFDKILAYRTRHFTMVAEDTFQDHNAGALVRTCDCFGIQDLYIIEEFNEYRIAKGMAQGAQKWVNTHFFNEYDNNIQACIDHVRAKGYSVVAASPHHDDNPVDHFDIRKKAAFFFGTEKKGLSKSILAQADSFVKIPIYGFTESFNVSVAAALLLQSLTSRLHNSAGINWKLSEEEMLDVRIEWAIKSIRHGASIANRFLKSCS